MSLMNQISPRVVVSEGSLRGVVSATVYCDGASRGNPGASSYGFAVMNDDDPGDFVYREAACLGSQTNNFAEYLGVVAALSALTAAGVKKVTLKSDSQLMVRQMQGHYRVKAEGLKPLHQEAQRLLKGFRQIQFLHIPREENREADALANRALDSAH